MQQRQEPHDSLDDFPTPPWATRALCEWVEREVYPLSDLDCRDPAANRGYMARPLAEYFGRVEASDIFDYGVGYPLDDFLFPGGFLPIHWTVTNPPFRLAQQFIARARETSTEGVAIFVRSAFLEGQQRHENLFAVDPPTYVLQFSERVVIHRGKVVADGSSATSYSFLVWTGRDQRPGRKPEFDWIAPCRWMLERPGDYDAPGVNP